MSDLIPPINKINKIEKLKEHLILSKMNHHTQIIKSTTLKDAHIYCVINNISTQQYGSLLEKYIMMKYNYIKNKTIDCIGDFCKNGKNSELKVSLGGITHTKFNFVQLRPSHKCDTYILTAYHLIPDNVDNEGELYIFNVPNVEIKKIILLYGGYAHGTIKKHGIITSETLNDEHNLKEYAIRPSINDDCWKALLPFRISETAL
jgi:hypothetical protein